MTFRDATDATFADDVVERSRELPVVVDFWADWCAPCRQLAPALEQAVAATDGAVELVKVDVDANPRTALAYRIQGIPAVKAFRDGHVVDEFTGAVPRAEIDVFLRGLLPSEADRLVAAGDEASLRRALELEPNHPGAIGALARLELADDEELAEAAQALDAGEVERALRLLLDAIPRGGAETRDRVRRAMIGVFTQLGQNHPLSLEYRRRLAASLN